MAEERRDNEVVLPLGTHALVLDTNQGRLQTHTGPTKITIAGTEKTVVFDPAAPSRFREVTPSQAIQLNKVVPKGSYAILKHPHKDLSFPREGKPDELIVGSLETGKIVNLPGPMAFSLWPGQEVQIVEGHHLKTNEYLVVRVYDEEEARKNWTKSTILVAEAVKTDATPEQGIAPQAKSLLLGVDPKTLVIGQLLLIQGTDVSFFIPPTGIEVVQDENKKFVRQAETLERLEYCLLVHQDGTKRYERGSQVVFPSPTEKFKLNDDGEKKSRAYELNEISGIHIKVIQDYSDVAPEGSSRGDLEAAGFTVETVDNRLQISNKEGDELFITGKVQAIYFPRVEHAILTYQSGTDDTKRRSRHHAIQVASGEARYVMDRITGKVATVRGETMLLPDPRTQVVVQRVLSRAECARYYPGNADVLAFNDMLRSKSNDPEMLAMFSNSATTSFRTGHVDPDGALRSMAYSGAVASRAGDTINRSARFTQPRTLVRDTSDMTGAPRVSPWTGYAVQTVNARGEREVVVGPQTINLEFDQYLETLFLSKGTPKRHDALIETVYLKIVNNVTDEFDVMTKDLVPVRIRLKYLIRFENDRKSSWFNVDNYVQLLVDHFRSVVGNLARQESAPDFYLNAASKLRDWVLGPQVEGARKPRVFEENGMCVYDVEIAAVTIQDPTISTDMKATQTAILKAQFEITQLSSTLNATKQKEVMTREIASEKFATTQHAAGITVKTVELQHAETERRDALMVLRDKAKHAADREIAEMRDAITAIETKIELAEWEPSKQKSIHDLNQEIERMLKQATAMETRSKAIQPELIAAFVSLAQTGALEVVARHLGNLAIIQDKTLAGTFRQVFDGIPGMEKIFDNMATLGKGKLLEQPAAAS